MRLQRILFTLGWRLFLLLYFCIGVGALVIMYLIEARFFEQMTRHLLLASVLAGLLESVKVGTSSIKQALAIARKVSPIRVSFLLRGFTAICQTALILLSLICSVMVVTAYLDGTYEESATPHVMVRSAVMMIQSALGIEVNTSLCISGFALLLSGLLQGAVYIVFGHLLATQAAEIEHIFLMKVQKTEAKKNSMPNS